MPSGKKRTKGSFTSPPTDELGYLVGTNSASDGPSRSKSKKTIAKQNAQPTLSKSRTRVPNNILQPPSDCLQLKWKKTLSKNRFITLREGDVYFGDLRFRHFPPILQERPTDPQQKVLTNRIYDVSHNIVIDQRAQNHVQMIEEVKYSDFVQHTSSDPKVAPVTVQKVGRTSQPNSLWRARGKIATPDFMVIYAPHDQIKDIMDYVMYDERYKDNNVMDCGAHSPYVTPEMFFGLIKEKHPYAIFYYKYVLDLYPEVHGTRSSRKTNANDTQYHLAPSVVKGHWQKIEWHRAENSYFKEVPSDQYDKVLAELTIGITNEEGRVSECFQDMYVDAEALYKVEWVKGSVLYMKEIPEYMPEPYQDVMRDFEGVGEWKKKKIEGLTPKVTDYQNEGDMFSVYSRFWYCQSDRFADNDALLDFNNTQHMVTRSNNNPLMVIAGDKEQIMDCIERQIEVAVKAKVSQADIDAEYETRANIDEVPEPDGLTVAPSLKAPRVKGLQASSIGLAAEFDVPNVFDEKTAVSGIVYDGALDVVYMDLERAKKVDRWVVKNTLQYDDELLFGWNQDEGRAYRALYPSVLLLYRILGDGTSENPFRQYGEPGAATHASGADFPFIAPVVNFEHNKRGFYIGRAGGSKLDPLVPKDPYFGDYWYYPGEDFEGEHQEEGPFHYIVIIGFDEKAGSYDGAFFLHNGHNIGKFVPQFNDWDNRPQSAKQVFDKNDGTALMNYVCDRARINPEGIVLTEHMNEYLDQEKEHVAEQLDATNSKVSMNNEEGDDDETMTEEKEILMNKELDPDESQLQAAFLQESGNEASGSMGTHGPEAELTHALDPSKNPFSTGVSFIDNLFSPSKANQLKMKSRPSSFKQAADAAITMGQAPDGYKFTTKMYSKVDWTANSNVMTVPPVPNPRDPATHFDAGIIFGVDIQDYDGVKHIASQAHTPFTVLEKAKFTTGKDHFITIRRFNKKNAGLNNFGWYIDNKRVPGQNFPDVKTWRIPGRVHTNMPVVKDLMIQMQKYDRKGKRSEIWGHLEPAPYAESRLIGTTIPMDKTATKAIKCTDIWIYQHDAAHAGYILLIGQYHFDQTKTITFKPAATGLDASEATTMTMPNGDVWPYFIDHFAVMPITYVIAGHVNAAGNLTDNGAPIQLEAF